MPRITSTSAMTGTGFMKCIPMKRSGRRVAAASRVIEMEEVLVARIAPALQRRSSLPKSSFFTASFSTMASMTASAEASASSEVVVVTRARAAAFSSAVRLPLATSRSRFFSIAPRAFSRNRSSTSTRTTEQPAAAATWAIPLPIWPPPTTPSERISMARTLSVAGAARPLPRREPPPSVTSGD